MSLFPSHLHFSSGFHLPSNFLPVRVWACKELLIDSCENCWNWMHFSVCVFTQDSADRNALMIALVRRLCNRHLHASWFWPSLCSLKNLDQGRRSDHVYLTRPARRSVLLQSTRLLSMQLTQHFPRVKITSERNAVVCT